MSTISLSQKKRIDMNHSRAGLHKDKENIEFKGKIYTELKNNATSPLESTGKQQVSFKGGIIDGVKTLIKGEEVLIGKEQFEYLTNTYYKDEPEIVAFWKKQLYKDGEFVPVKVKNLSLAERFQNLGKEAANSWNDILKGINLGSEKAGKTDKQVAEEGIGNLYRSVKHAKKDAKAKVNGPFSRLFGRYKDERKILEQRKQFLKEIGKCTTEADFNKVLDTGFTKGILTGTKDGIRNGARKYIGKDAKSLKRLIKRNFADKYKNTVVTKKVKDILNANYISQILKSPGGNYGSNTFQATNRIASGLISATFVAKDFYNYSMYLKNDPGAAKKESRSKFKQELWSRVGLTAALTYITTSMFRDKCDASLRTSLAMGLGVTAFSEVAGRLIAGRSVLPILRLKKKSKNKPAENDNQAKNKQKVAFAGGMDFLKKLVEKNEMTKKLDLLKAISPKKGEFVEKVLKKENSGSLKGINDKLFFGKNGKHKRVKKVVESIFLPVVWIVKTSASLAASLARFVTGNKELFIDKTKASVKDIKIADKYLEILNKSVKNKAPKLDLAKATPEQINQHKAAIEEEFGKLLSSKANSPVAYDPVALGTCNKVFGSALAAGFYALDTYNLGMKNSDGDYGTALGQARGRIAQDVTRVGVSSWFVAASNNFFSWLNNHSILGAAALTVGNVSAYEAATRLSVGMPLGKHTQKELIEIDEKQKNQKGLVGSFRRTMSRLTGKKSLSEKVKKGEQPQMPLYASNIKAQPIDKINITNTSEAAKMFYKHFKEMSADATKVDDNLVPSRFKDVLGQNYSY